MKRSGIDQASILKGKRPWEISEGPPGGKGRKIAHRPGEGDAEKEGGVISNEGVYPPGVFDQEGLDLLLGYPFGAHDRNRVAKNVIVPPAAVFFPLVLVPNILGDEDLLDISGFDDLDDFIDPLVVRGEVDVSLLERVIPLAAEEIVFEDQTFFQEFEPVLGNADGPVDVVHGGAGEVGPGFLEDVQTAEGASSAWPG